AAHSAAQTGRQILFRGNKESTTAHGSKSSVIRIRATAVPNTIAAVLSTFSFDGGSLAVTSELFGGSTSDITLGSSWNIPAVTDNRLAQPASATGTSVISPAHRVGFTYTVTGLAANETLDITTASIDHTGASSTYRFNYLVNGSTLGTNFDPPNSGTYTGNIGSSAIGMSAAAGLVNGDSFTIAFTTRDNTAGGTLTLDNFVLSGEVNATAVPEPSSLAVLGVGFAGLVLRRRKRQLR
ncbi:MAG: PEP-CTERM sorting domain-containing protein, partial [Rubripirellula sp.]